MFIGKQQRLRRDSVLWVNAGTRSPGSQDFHKAF